MTPDLLKKLEAEKQAAINKIEAEYKDKIKAAEKIESAKSDLNDLVTKHGFKSVKQFLTDLGYIKTEGAAPVDASTVENKRTKVTEEIEAKIVEMINDKKTATEIAEKFNVSTSTVNNIKKANGLTKPRGKKA